jgi:hypothetical protein
MPGKVAIFHRLLISTGYLSPMLRRITEWLASETAPRVFVGLHLLLLAVLFAQHGIVDDKEALKYLGCAQGILQGDLSDLLGNYLKYGAYVLFLLPFVAVGLPQLAVLAQVALGLWAARALGRLVERTSQQRAAGHLAMGLLLLCVPVQTWTLALYTESFFTSVAILFVERITRDQRPDAWTIVLTMLTVFARPVGMLFVGPALLWKAAQHPAFAPLRPLLPVGYAAVLLLAISLPGIRAPQLEPIVEAHVIAGFPRDPGAMAHFEGSSILAAQVFLLQRHGAGEWALLFLRRSASLLNLTRPYYSTAHNALNGLWMLLYPLALWGLWRERSHPTVRLMAAMLLLHMLLVGLTHDEWSGRFLVPLVGPLLIAATLALAPARQPSPAE